MPVMTITNCGNCPFFHMREAEIGYTLKGICLYDKPWKYVPDDTAYYKVLDDCPMRKEPITLKI